MPIHRSALPAAFVFLAGLATILAAWGFQLIGHYVPCKLCLEERVPYYIGVPLALVALLASYPSAPLWLQQRRIFLGCVAIIFLYGAYLGTYHAGAEWGWWPGPSDCGATGAGAATTGADLLNRIKNIHIVSCTDTSWRFPAGWGLSFAGWNAVVSFVLAVVAAFGAARRDNKA